LIQICKSAPKTVLRPISEDEVVGEDAAAEGKENVRKTPKKNRLTELEADRLEVRRSPRKHPGSRNAGFSKLTITGSAIVNQHKVTALHTLF
jgi:hypothetical protein